MRTRIATGFRNGQTVILLFLSLLLFLQYVELVEKSNPRPLTSESSNGDVNNTFSVFVVEDSEDGSPSWMKERRRIPPPVVVDWDNRVQVKRQWLQYVRSQMPTDIIYKSRKRLPQAEICRQCQKELQNSTIIHSLKTPSAVGYDESNSHNSKKNNNTVSHLSTKEGTEKRKDDSKVKNITKHYHAFIVPYRDRKHHLEQFLLFMSRYLQYHYGHDRDAYDFVDQPEIQRLRNKIGVDVAEKDSQETHQHFFSLYLIEQDDNELFNRALLQNVGLDHVAPNVECVIQHDVDVVPAFHSHVPYHICQQPTHLAVRAEVTDFKAMYETFVGMAMTIHQQHWACLNGMDNQMQGWGKEDDELFIRLMFLGMADCSNGQNGSPFRAESTLGNVFNSISQEPKYHTQGRKPWEAATANAERQLHYRRTGLSPSVSSSGGWNQTKYNIVSRNSWDISDEILQGFHEIHHIKVKVDKKSLEKCFLNCSAS